MSELCLGFDIGGTKCAVITGRYNNGDITLIDKAQIPTDTQIPPEEMIAKLIDAAEPLLGDEKPAHIGISCGSPLNSKTGYILSPPNLPGWDDVPITKILTDHFGVKSYLQNDANACAVAEWKFGAGRGTENMIFLTFGTGFGAGLILNGALYEGTNGNAGEIGHCRIAENGPWGYNKYGSMEGFCSGGGIHRLGLEIMKQYLERSVTPSFFDEDENKITAKAIAQAAYNGDACALEVYKICGKKLGAGLALLIDLFNPQRIVIGSIYARSHDLLDEYMYEAIKAEALPHSAAVCEIVSAALSENIGDYAAIAAAFI